MDAVTVRELHVSYGDVQAVRGVSLTVAEGEIVGILGPNGAGKTSLVEVCEGYRDPTSGTVQVLGRTPGDRSLHQDVGVVLQDVGVTPFLSVTEALTRNAAYYDRPRAVGEVIEQVGLTEKAGGPGQHPVRRAAAAPGPRARPDRLAAAAVPGRAHHRF